MVAMLVGCGLRRAELLALQLESIQQREEHWVIADLVGKGGHVRTVPIPIWVKHHVDQWTAAAAVTHGPVFRAINKAGRVLGRRHVGQGALGCRPRCGVAAMRSLLTCDGSRTSMRLLSHICGN